MGLNKAEAKTYLRISYGKVCKTAKEDTPDAVSRVTSKGETVWELQWESISGVLQSIAFKDNEFGKTWSVTLQDGIDTFVLQINEDSRYGIDFLKKLPNLYQGHAYTFKPYEYEKNKKKKMGVWINEGEKKIDSYYQEFTQKADQTWDIKDLHDFPKFDGDVKDKDELKIYFMRLAKFLRTKAMAHLANNFQNEPHEVTADVPKVEDDLPF